MGALESIFSKKLNAYMLAFQVTRMCDTCSSIFRSNEKHEQSECPLGSALFCSCCKVSGHATLKCQNQTLWNHRVPEYIEQLIPFELRVHHAIPSTSMTPIAQPNSALLPCAHRLNEIALEQKDYARKGQVGAMPRPGAGDTCNQCRPVMEIPEDKDGGYTSNIRATLASNNIPSSSIKKNKEALEKLAAATGKKVVFILRDGLKNAGIAELAAIEEKEKAKLAAPKPAEPEAHAGSIKSFKKKFVKTPVSA